MTDRLCTPEEANAFHPPPRQRNGARVLAIWLVICALAISAYALAVVNPPLF